MHARDCIGLKLIFGICAAIAASGLVLSLPVHAAGEGEPAALVNAQRELFAARYENAAALYRMLLAAQPSDGDAWYGLVRAELRAHHSHDAYKAADEALRASPGSPGAQTAAGMAMYRRGDLSTAEGDFRAALRINPNYPGALAGLASVYSAVSMFKSARDLELKAYRQAPGDPY